MTDLADQRRVVGLEIRIEEILRVVVGGITDRAVEVADEVGPLLRPAFRQGVMQRDVQSMEPAEPRVSLERVVDHGLAAGDVPPSGVESGPWPCAGYPIVGVREV